MRVVILCRYAPSPHFDNEYGTQKEFKSGTSRTLHGRIEQQPKEENSSPRRRATAWDRCPNEAGQTGRSPRPGEEII